MSKIFKKCLNISLVLILISLLSKCLANIIDESEVEDLRKSVEHFMQYSKNITTIPQDCTDRPYVEIDIVFEIGNKNSSKYYAVYGKNQFYVEIESITRDHLPVIHRDTQPKPVDSQFRRTMNSRSAINEYIFVGPLYLYRIPDQKGKYLFIGFNQVWVGCPQPLCISPGFDGILSLTSAIAQSNHFSHYMPINNQIIIFRGNYFWFYSFDADKPPVHPTLTEMASRVEDRWVDTRVGSYYSHSRRSKSSKKMSYLNDSMVVPTYIDAVVPGINSYNSCLYFFKGNEFVCYEWYTKISKPMNITKEWKVNDKSVEDWRKAQIDAAFNIKSLIYFIAGEQLWCFDAQRSSCHSYPKKLKDIHKDFPMNITTAFEHQNYIYIIKGPVYYRVNASKFPMKTNTEAMNEKFIFEDLLGCEEGLYTAWGFEDYNNFIEKYAKRMEKGFNYSLSDVNSGYNPTIFIIIFFLSLTVCSVIITVWYFRQKLFKFSN